MADYPNHGSLVLEDGEFWLPPQFLSDEDNHHTSPGPRTFPPALGVGFFHPPEFRTGWRSSNLSSPGESVVGSAEDSDEEDFIAHLTHKVAQSTLGDGFQPHRSSKGLYSSGSPKSTLRSGCGCDRCSIWGNHGGTGRPQMKSAMPPTLDLLCQAAGKVANMRLDQQRRQIQRAAQSLQWQRLNHLIQLSDSKSEISSYPYQASSQQPIHFQPPQSPGIGGRKYGKTESALSSSTWPTLQQARQPRRVTVSAGRAIGMRPVLLGSNNAIPRGCAGGTGVFLPRQAGVAPDPEPKRKQGCPTVLIPARVAQALNLNLVQMGSHPQIQPRYDGGARNTRGGGRHVTQQQPAVGQEISLPPEWTY